MTTPRQRLRGQMDLLSAAQVAHVFDVSLATVRASVRRGELPHPAHVAAGVRFWTYGQIKDTIKRHQEAQAYNPKLPQGRPRKLVRACMGGDAE